MAKTKKRSGSKKKGTTKKRAYQPWWGEGFVVGRRKKNQSLEDYRAHMANIHNNRADYLYDACLTRCEVNRDRNKGNWEKRRKRRLKQGKKYRMNRKAALSMSG